MYLYDLLQKLNFTFKSSLENIITFLLFGTFIVGISAFIIFFVRSIKFVLDNKKKRHKAIFIAYSLLVVLLFPPFLILKIISTVRLKDRKETALRLGFALLVFIFILPTWVGTYFVFGAVTSQFVIAELGYSPITETIVGTGSMYPTFPKSNKLTPKEQYQDTVASANFINYPSGIVIFGKRYFDRQLKRGDIITFRNKKTEEETKKSVGTATGFLKRLIALPGDTLMLKSGIVYLNGKSLKEPYTAKPRSTFAEAFLSECTLIKVPPNKIFAMGDNRKGSGDSREIGFVDFNEITEVLPIESQKGVWDKKYRDTSKDFDEASKIKIDKQKYLKLINSKRKEAKLRLLKYQPKLEKSALFRGETILKFDDFSWEATRSGYTMSKAMRDANYSNITYGELPAQGYFEADELIDNHFQFAETKDFLLNKDYQEVGIAEVEGKINDCPTQIIVLHLAGYVPPNYSADLINSWEKILINLRDIQGSWQELKKYVPIYSKYKNDVDRINDIIAQRISMVDRIVTKMKANQWLSTEEDRYTRNTDKALADEEYSLADKLNNL